MSSLQTDRTNLVPLKMEHLSRAYVDWLNDQDVNQFLETRHEIQTLDKVKEFIVNNSNTGNQYIFAILLKENNMHIGNVKIGAIHSIYKYADLSYFIGEKESWNKGVATEVLIEICNYAFKILKMHRLNAGYFENNTASAKVLSNLGFQVEGIFKEKLIFKDKRVAHIMCGLLKSEWRY